MNLINPNSIFLAAARFRAGAALFLPLAFLPGLAGQSVAAGGELPAVAVHSTRVANQTPSGSIPMAVSGLRFEPRVDVQSRNLAEAQADVSIRGGHFENTGIKLGALAVLDPQTGHYLTELPVSPAMLAPPDILVGVRNAAEGFNAGVGTVAYGWRAIDTRGEATVGWGDHGFNLQSVYQGFTGPARSGGLTLAGDVAWARSTSDGTVPFGDHDFSQVSGRVQVRGDRTQTDVFAGYQAKFFGWPNLYTPFGFNETENLQTVLVGLNHRGSYGAGNWVQWGGYYRRNKDDYEFNRPVPGASNPFQHTTHVRSATLEGRHALPSFALDYNASWLGDRIRSTSLTFGRYRDRNLVKLSAVGETTTEVSGGRLTSRLGAVYDDSDRDSSALSPVISLSLNPTGTDRHYYVEYSGATQLATYTALNSNPNAGLFRGNPNVGREKSRNLEIGARFEAGGWNLETAAFHRRDGGLVDWTFRKGVTARTANPVDVGTLGVELIAVRRIDRIDVVFGYTFMEKDADYRGAVVDASFYALNFARHRLTAAVTWRMGGGWSIRSDNEWRLQQANPLRIRGGDSAVLSELALTYAPPAARGLEFSLQAGNLWDSDFEEVPSVPASRRQVSGSATWRW